MTLSNAGPLITLVSGGTVVAARTYSLAPEYSPIEERSLIWVARVGGILTLALVWELVRWSQQLTKRYEHG